MIDGPRDDAPDGSGPAVDRLAIDAEPGGAIDVIARRCTFSAASPPHATVGVQFVVVLGGFGVLATPDGEHPLRRGAVAVLRAAEWYEYADCEDLQVIEVHVHPDIFTGELAWISHTPEFVRCFRPRPRGSHFAVDLPSAAAIDRAERWSAELLRHRGGGAGARALTIGYLTLLLGEIASAAVAPELAPVGRNDFHPSVLRVMQLLEHHIEVDWDLTSLAHVVNLAPAYLVRLFKKQVGLPPMAYLGRLRVDRVATLLIETELSLRRSGSSSDGPIAHPSVVDFVRRSL